MSGIVLLSFLGTGPYFLSGTATPQFPQASGAWNPRVPCSSPWIVRITDITNNQTGSSSLSSSLFNPGITSPVGAAKRWLTPGATPPGWVSPGPPCTITNSHGTVAMFVEIDGIKRVGIVNEDCTGNYDTVNGGTSNGGSYCDSTFNMYDPSVVPNYSSSCTSATDPTCYGRIHVEIDHDWKAAHYCGPSTTCDDGALGSQTTTSSLLDIQGFISWDPGNLAQSWHSFNGWEIHPITGWRLHQSNPTPDFTISANPSSISALAGSPATSTITIAPVNGFSGTVALSVSSSPGGLSCSLNPTSVTLGSLQTSNLSCNGAAGTYAITVLGTSGSLSHSTQVTDKVSDFTIAASPTSVSLTVGNTGSSTITVSAVNSFTDTVSLTSSVNPSTGLTCSLSPSTVAGAGTSSLACTAVSSNTYTVTVIGSDGSLSHSTQVTYNVAATDFTISANPTTVNINSSATGTSTITIAPINGFSGTVALNSTVSPIGLSCSLSPTSVVLGTSQTSTLSCSGSAGTYVVTITGTSASLSHSVNVAYNVASADFSISASPTTVSVNAGTPGNSTITATPVNGFSGTVSLASTVLPSGLTCSLAPSSLVLGGAQTSTLSCSGSAGTYTITVTGTTGSTAHSAQVTYNVMGADFAITANPTTITSNAGSSSASTITIAPINGFTGSVSLATFVNASGLTCSITPTSVTIGGAQSSSLTCSGSEGSYMVTVTGTAGPLSHTLGVTFIEQDFTITPAPSSISSTPNATGSSTITLASLNGYSATVALSVNPSNGLVASTNPNSVSVSPGGTAASTLTVSSSIIGNYTVTVTATAGSLTHSIQLKIVVSDFSLTATRTSLTLHRSSTNSSLITASSLNGFTGTVTLSVTITPAGLRGTLSTNTIVLNPQGSGSSTLTLKASKRTPIGSYVVKVTATSGTDSHTITILVTVTA